MKKYRIDTTHGSAETDIENIFNYIAVDSPQNAVKWYFDVKEKIQTLDTMPERCPVAPESRYVNFTVYHLIFGNYRILYRIEGNVVQLLYVRG